MTVLTTDFHTHILPGIDDGCSSVVDSIQMLRYEFEQGVKRVFLTPHFIAQQMYPDAFLASREFSMETLMDSIDDVTCIPELILGAEVKFYPGISKWEQLDQLALGDTKHILIELSPYDFSDEAFEELEAIYLERDIVPIIAHVERYLTHFNRRSILKKMSSLPVLLQYNCSFFLEKNTKNLALKLLNNRNVHLISSDCHSLSWRPPCLQQARDFVLSMVTESTVTFLSDMEDDVVFGRNRYPL